MDKLAKPPKTVIAIDSTVIRQNQARIDSLFKVSQEIKTKMHVDSVKNIAALKAFKIENTRLRKKLAESRIEIQPMIDSIPVLNEFVDNQDSLIALQQARIDSLEAQNARQFSDFTDLITASEERFKAATATSTDLNQQLTKSLSETNRLQREAKKRFSIGPSLGIDYRGQPTVSFGVGYSLFRF